MENDRLLKLLEDCTMTDEDAVGMIFGNFIDIGGTLVGLTVENAIKAGALLREYDKRCLLKAPPGRRTTAST
jgi:DNA-binding transcriptional regulator LsrR (DeoR family)